MRGEKVERFCKECKSYEPAVRNQGLTGLITYKCLRCGNVTVIQPKIPVSLQKPPQKTKKEPRQTTLLFFYFNNQKADKKQSSVSFLGFEGYK